MRLVEADTDQHLYHTCYTMRLQVHEYVLQVIRENLTSWKQMLTNEVNKSQTFRLLYSNPYKHTHITQHSHLLIGLDPSPVEAPGICLLVSSW